MVSNIGSFFNTFIPYPNFIKRFILKTFGAKVGKSVIIKPRVRIKYPWFLHIEIIHG